MKKTLKIVGPTLLILLGAYIALIFYTEKYSPSERFIWTCGWEDMIEGPCDKRDSDAILTKEEIEWVMKFEKVSKEEIIEFAKQHIDYRKKQAEEYKQKGIPSAYTKQINRLENVIKTLQEQ